MKSNKLSVPKPDKVIYLDVKPEVSQKLMSKRYEGDEGEKDLHEKNFGFLLEYKNAPYMPLKVHWIFDCCENGEIKPIESIARK